MRRAEVYLHGVLAGHILEKNSTNYSLTYLANYEGNPISQTLPVKETPYFFNSFPSYFDGLLPEGYQLNILLKTRKIDAQDYMSQLLAISDDFAGAVSLLECEL